MSWSSSSRIAERGGVVLCGNQPKRPTSVAAKSGTSTSCGAPVGEFEVVREFTYDNLQRLSSTETKFPESALLGELSDARYTSSVTYDALGQVASTSSVAEREIVPGTRTSLWPLPNQTFTTGLGRGAEIGDTISGLGMGHARRCRCGEGVSGRVP